MKNGFLYALISIYVQLWLDVEVNINFYFVSSTIVSNFNEQWVAEKLDT